MCMQQLFRFVTLLLLFASGAVSSTAWGQSNDSTQSARKIAITIDDGPSIGAGDNLERYLKITDGIREAFLAEKVPAILFINENQLNVPGQRDARTQAVQRWLDCGLELGNHTYSHLRPEVSALHRYYDDIVKGETISRPLLAAMGKQLTWFRYPFLATESGPVAESIEQFLVQRGYRIAPVTVDYKDYSFASNYARYLRAGQTGEAQRVVDEVLTALDRAFEFSEQESQRVLGYELPQILLIHCNEMNSSTLRQAIARIRQRGYQFVSLDEAMRDPAYSTPNLPPGTLGGGALVQTIGRLKRNAN